MVEYWYNALRSERGVVIFSTEREKARQRLYAARAEAADPALEALSLVLSPTDPNEIWIVKKAPP